MTSSITLVSITSDDVLEDIETHFKIIAGPGAGKTYWLVEHIKNVLKNSTRLLSTSKIACITYTNVAVEEIQQRLETTGNRVEVSTIHSFLYNNIVKPYAYLLKDESGKCLINYEEMDGHDEHIPSKGRISNLITKKGLYKRIKEDKSLYEAFMDLDWVIEDEEIKLLPKKEYNRIRLSKLIERDLLYVYKRLYWCEGTIHHEDVLYFSYLILEEYPMILEFLSARYPYIFIDEFQDTSPMQTKIIKQLANAGVVIGVIGDPAQSIYKFNGAARQDFLDFELSGQRNFSMNKNRRSINKIINFLNYLRNSSGFQQDYHRNIEGNDICLVTGVTSNHIINKFKEERVNLGLKNTYCMITRRNESVTELKSCIGNCNCNHKLWEELYFLDIKRHRFLNYIFMAQEYARDKRYEGAVKEILKLFRTDKEGELREPFKGSIIKEKMLKRSYAISLLEFLINNYEENLDKTLYQFYNEVLNDFFCTFDFKLVKLVGSGKFKKKSEIVTVRELVNSLNLKEVKTDEIRTIHKTKGTEFESVLVYFDDASEIDKIINPDIDNEKDDYRLYYVALSRAKDFLCVATESMEDEQVERCKELNIRVL